jgi:hypothetical protein
MTEQDQTSESAATSVAERQALAVELRKLGDTPQVIAEQLRALPGVTADYDARMAFADVAAGLREQMAEDPDAGRLLDLLRLDDLLAEWWERAKVDPAAFANVLRIMEQRERLIAAAHKAEPEALPEPSTAFDEAGIQAAFAGLTEPHIGKKKATIVALVDARLAGKSEESVWGRDEVCNRRTYHMKWKQDPVFAQCLADVWKLAQEWKDSRAVRALREAAERMALASPLAALTATKLLQADDDRLKLQAAFGILDRAGMETASKAAGPAMPGVLVVLPDNGRGDRAAEAPAGTADQVPE